ncbi:GAF domain-containing protein [Streptomyces sp. NPDC002577]
MSQRSDLRRRRAELEDEWSRWVPWMKTARWSPAGAGALRSEVSESWVRSLVSVDPARDSAPVSDGDALRQRWAVSPLRRPVDDLADELRSIAEDAGFVTAVTDESGTILWTCGGRTMRRRAEQVDFAPGGRWDEEAMGTNALSLALRTGRPSSVFSAEHLVTALHGWVCYCAPVHSPDGRILGVLDLSTTWDRSHPPAVSTVRTLVSTIEARLRTELPGQGHRDAAPVRLTCMGAEEAAREGRLLALRPRQLEILALLALEPNGRGCGVGRGAAGHRTGQGPGRDRCEGRQARHRPPLRDCPCSPDSSGARRARARGARRSGCGAFRPAGAGRRGRAGATVGDALLLHTFRIRHSWYSSANRLSWSATGCRTTRTTADSAALAGCLRFTASGGRWRPARSGTCERG